MEGLCKYFMECVTVYTMDWHGSEPHTNVTRLHVFCLFNESYMHHVTSTQLELSRPGLSCDSSGTLHHCCVTREYEQ